MQPDQGLSTLVLGACEPYGKWRALQQQQTAHEQRQQHATAAELQRVCARERRKEADEWAHLNLKFKRNPILQWIKLPPNTSYQCSKKIE
jgi:hypothetical protein